MKKTVVLITLFVFALCQMQAQTTECVRTFTPACGQAGNVSFTFGQPFYQQTAGASGLEVAEGVQQAQILYKHYDLASCQNDEAVSPETLVRDYNFFRGYNGTIAFDGRDLHILPAGHYDSTDIDSRHYSWDGPFNYDSVTTMILDVWPIYEVYDTLRLDINNMGEYAEGDIDKWRKTHDHDCDSLVHYYVLTCGEEIADADGNVYNTLFVGPYCWTQQNLQPTHYMNLDSTLGSPIPNAMIYYSVEHSDEQANLARYGRLYSWYSAVNVPDGSSENPPLVAGEFVQGICPVGWHIPSERNMESLAEFGAPALKSTILWLQPGNNSTDFTAYPAGFYNPNTGRFENMLGETRYWTTQSIGTASAWNGVLSNNCDELLMDAKTKNYGYSVRCVKDQLKNL